MQGGPFRVLPRICSTVPIFSPEFRNQNLEPVPLYNILFYENLAPDNIVLFHCIIANKQIVSFVSFNVGHLSLWQFGNTILKCTQIATDMSGVSFSFVFFQDLYLYFSFGSCNVWEVFFSKMQGSNYFMPMQSQQSTWRRI